MCVLQPGYDWKTITYLSSSFLPRLMPGPTPSRFSPSPLMIPHAYVSLVVQRPLWVTSRSLLLCRPGKGWYALPTRVFKRAWPVSALRRKQA